MKIKEYAALREAYRMPEHVECAGNAVDWENNAWLSIGVSIQRDTYHETGYLCYEGASEVFHACVCALLEQIRDMPIIKTVLLTPEMIYGPVCQGEEPTEEMRYCASMALCALREAFQGCLTLRRSAGAAGGANPLANAAN